MPSFAAFRARLRALAIASFRLASAAGLGASAVSGAYAHLPIDLALHRPAATTLFIDFDRNSIPDVALTIGLPGDRLMSADMDGDGLTDLVLYRNGAFYVDRTFTGAFTEGYALGGVPGDVGLVGDVDGDGTPDIVVFRGGLWYASTHRDGRADRVFGFGGPGDKPLLCDIDFDGTADLVVFRDGLFYIDTDRDGIADAAVPLGRAGAEPFCADFDGDGRDDVGVFRDGTWLALLDPIANPHRSAPLYFGAPGDRPLAGRFDRRFSAEKFRTARFRFGVHEPAVNQLHFRIGDESAPALNLAPDAPAGVAVAGDFDGDGRTDIAIFTAGVWRVDFDMDGRTDLTVAFGMAGDTPLAGDVNGDGIADFVVYRNGIWYVDTDGDGVADLGYGFGGVPGDRPLLADVDGDGRADLVIYRNGFWYVDTNHDGIPNMAFALGGVPGDVPVMFDRTGDGRADPAIYRAGTWLLSRTPSFGQVEATVSLGDAASVPLAGNFVLDLPGAPMLFSAKARAIPGAADRFITSPAYDVDGDGWVDMIGGHNVNGTIQPQDWSAIGLASLFSAGRFERDARFADVDNDGVTDIVANTYSPLAETASFARLYHGNGDGTYAEDATFAALAIRGFGETIVVADFDNDGIPDIFIPYYSHNSPAEHSYLLTRPPGTPTYSDVADAAGVALRGIPSEIRPEAAQAVDYDGDGLIDLYVAGHLFRNTGNLAFTDVTVAAGLAAGFDEGAKFVDWNNDGKLDLIVHHPNTGPVLWEFDGTRFHRRDVFPSYAYANQNGLHVADFNGDGREDVVVGSGSPQGLAVVFRNDGTRFSRVPFSLLEGARFGTLSSADFDRDGRRDLLLQRAVGSAAIAKGLGPALPAQIITIEVRDALGRRNQQGRVVRLAPADASGRTFTRVVDGGSGYLSQTAYAVEFASDFAGVHQGSVRFATGVVTFSATGGQRLRVYADGRVETY